jgi:hypothetical protein
MYMPPRFRLNTVPPTEPEMDATAGPGVIFAIGEAPFHGRSRPVSHISTSPKEKLGKI